MTQVLGGLRIPQGAVNGYILTSDAQGNAAWAAAPAGAAAPARVTSLPGSPVDGQEVYYQSTAVYARSASMVTDAIIWHLRYSTVSGKWEFLGGGPLCDEVEASVAGVSANGWVDLAGSVGPQVTVPLVGDYIVRGVAVSSGAASANYYHQLAIKRGANAVAAGDIISQDTRTAGSVFGGIIQHAGQARFLAVPAATALKMQYNNAGAANSATPTWGGRRLEVVPIRVG